MSKPDNTQGLDEILLEYADTVEWDAKTEETKQSILQWVADEVIKVPIDYSMSPDGYSVDMGVAERRMITEQLKVLAQHGWKGNSDGR